MLACMPKTLSPCMGWLQHSADCCEWLLGMSAEEEEEKGGRHVAEVGGEDGDEDRDNEGLIGTEHEDEEAEGGYKREWLRPFAQPEGEDEA